MRATSRGMVHVDGEFRPMSEGNTITCPGCSKRYAMKPEFAGRKLKCKCGTSIAVPAKAADTDNAYDLADAAPEPRTVVPPTKPAPAPLPRAGVKDASSRKPKSNSNDGPDFSNGFGAGSIVGGIVAVVVAIGVCLKVARLLLSDRDTPRSSSTSGTIGSTPADPEPVHIETSQDELAKEMMRRDAMVSMSSWLVTPPNAKTLGAFAVRDVRELHEKVWTKELGLEQVYASNKPDADAVVFVLPTDAAKRKAVFAWQEKWHRGQGAPVLTDKGSRMLIITMPPTKPGT
jgi:hypothetical protein